MHVAELTPSFWVPVYESSMGEILGCDIPHNFTSVYSILALYELLALRGSGIFEQQKNASLH